MSNPYQPPNGPPNRPPNRPPDQSSYQQQGYPQPMAYQQVYMQSPPKGASITSMVLGLVSIFLGFTFVVPILGFIFGWIGLAKEPAGRGMAVAGLILNGIMLLGWVLLAVFVFGVFGVMASSTAT